MADKQKILIVDDDENIAELISLYLTKECFETVIAYDGEDAILLYHQEAPDLILLDLMLPGIDGYEVCREIRKVGSTPIIMLSAKGEVFDKVLGLELGADDYMIKPFDSKELVARVKAVLRRVPKTDPASSAASGSADPSAAQGNPAGSAAFSGSKAPAPSEIVSYPGLVVNLSNYEVIYRGERLDMPPKELELLFFLASHPNQVFNREQLLDHIWGYSYIGDTRTVDVHIKRLREKLDGGSNWKLGTVWGVGYKFEVSHP